MSHQEYPQFISHHDSGHHHKRIDPSTPVEGLRRGQDPFASVKITDEVASVVRVPGMVHGSCRNQYIQFRACLNEAQRQGSKILGFALTGDTCWQTKHSFDHCMDRAGAHYQLGSLRNIGTVDPDVAASISGTFGRNTKAGSRLPI